MTRSLIHSFTHLMNTNKQKSHTLTHIHKLTSSPSPNTYLQQTIIMINYRNVTHSDLM